MEVQKFNLFDSSLPELFPVELVIIFGLNRKSIQTYHTDCSEPFAVEEGRRNIGLLSWVWIVVRSFTFLLLLLKLILFFR